MENKKLLNFLLKDLTEIDELFSEKKNSNFDQLELEFIQTRLKGAIKLVQIFNDREGSNAVESNSLNREIVKEVIEEKIVEEEVKVENSTSTEESENNSIPESVKEEVDKETSEIERKEIIETTNTVVDVELDEESNVNSDKRLGDSFLKEKSVNDLLAATNKLENVLSNRPVKTIQSAIGINDRFQYIRELFEGKADDFVKAVEELDQMNNLKDAVQFLQVNYKWKKNDTSLKFINLIKRRFPNE